MGDDGDVGYLMTNVTLCIPMFMETYIARWKKLVHDAQTADYNMCINNLRIYVQVPSGLPDASKYL